MILYQLPNPAKLLLLALILTFRWLPGAIAFEYKVVCPTSPIPDVSIPPPHWSLAGICPHYSTTGKNLGCRCIISGVVVCLPEAADYFAENRHLVEPCMRLCRCVKPTEDEFDLWIKTPMNSHSRGRDREKAMEEEWSSSIDVIDEAIADFNHWEAVSSKPEGLPQSTRNCNFRSCSSYSDCEKPRRRNDCRGVECHVVGSKTGDIGLPTFVGICAGSSHWKRDESEAKPCLCNSTYVSTTCCGAQDGLVWVS